MRPLSIGCFALWVAAVAAIYSALGFDWTKKIENTPSGRAFHYIEPFAARQMIRSQEIAPLFA
jgi:hypothetical protein